MEKHNVFDEIEIEKASDLVAMRYNRLNKNQVVGESQAMISLVGELFIDPDRFDASLFEEISMKTVLEYLSNGHKLYRDKKLPELQWNVAQLIESLGYSHPLSIYLTQFVKRYHESLIAHMDEEDNYVFPYINQLLKNQTKTSVLRPATFLNGWSNLATFLLAHTDTEADLNMVGQLLKSYSTQANLAPQINRILTQLSLLELDLHIHAKIEDEVLIPKALQLEKTICS